MKTKHAFLLPLLSLLLLLSVTLCSCGESDVYDYSADSAYAAFFTEEDDAQSIEMKNLMLAHIDAYNRGDAETFYALFDMGKEDYNFNVAQMKAIAATCKVTYTPEEIVTAFINEDNAQAMITMTCKGEDLQSGEVLYYYRTDLIYTLQRDGEWRILEQQNSGEFDLMDTLGSETEAATE